MNSECEEAVIRLRNVITSLPELSDWLQMRGVETRSRGVHGFGEQNARKHSPTFGPRGPEQRAVHDVQYNHGFQKKYLACQQKELTSGGMKKRTLENTMSFRIQIV